MTCPTCQAVLTEGSHFCSSCGAAINGATIAIADPPEMKLLAEANLLRMRGRWHDAEARCIDVMRADPNNVHAHSLLGDIYRDQNRYDEAAQWYQMALDLNADSAADRTKLEAVERERARRIARGPTPPGSLPSGTQKLMGLPPVVWVRGLTALTVLFLVLAAALLIMMQKGRRPVSAPSPGLPSVAQTPGTGSDTPAGASPLSPVPPLAMTPAPQEPAPPPVRSAGPSSPGGLAGALSPRENALISTLAQMGSPGPNMTVGGVVVDSRANQAQLLLVYRPDAREAAGGVARDAVLTAALRAAQSALQADGALRQVTVSVRVHDASGRTEPLFEGDLVRGATGFANIWWAAATAPPPVDEGDGYLPPS